MQPEKVFGQISLRKMEQGADAVKAPIQPSSFSTMEEARGSLGLRRGQTALGGSEPTSRLSESNHCVKRSLFFEISSIEAYFY
ncbi:hypothetical protein [Paenibacillus sp. 32352]|uniref:hypothetical protein n=1 Tax=Paenibacillus sp. 32352 TaxID=1969111 RepID=UPI001C4E0223|nr:hypothetical protein [Paenibacillus sp. 32352]